MIKWLHQPAFMALKQLLVIKLPIIARWKPSFIFRSRNNFCICIPCIVLAALTICISKRTFKKGWEITGGCVKGTRKNSYGAFMSRIFNSEGKNIRSLYSSLYIYIYTFEGTTNQSLFYSNKGNSNC